MSHSTHIKAVCDAMVSHLSTSLASLGMKSCAWSAGTRAEPVYPANPRTDCPLLRLRLYTADVRPGKVKQTTDVVLKASVYYYQRQTPGSAHQAAIVTVLETIVDTLAGDWRPSEVDALSGISLYSVAPEQVVVHDEMTHPLGDDPAMRVSVGEVSLAITYRSNG